MRDTPMIVGVAKSLDDILTAAVLAAVRYERSTDAQ